MKKKMLLFIALFSISSLTGCESGDKEQSVAAYKELKISGDFSKKSYIDGENWDLSGLVFKVTSENDVITELNHSAFSFSYSVSNSSDFESGNLIVTASLKKNNKITDSISISGITVNPRIISLDIRGDMAVKSYVINQAWNPYGLSLFATEERNHKQNVVEVSNDDIQVSFEPSAPNSLSLDHVKVTAQYNGAVTSKIINNIHVKEGFVELWTCIGASNSTHLNEITANIANKYNYGLTTFEKGTFDKIRASLATAIAVGDYPDLSMGLPDHFAEYLGSDVLVPFDDCLTQEELSDYYPEYMKENHMYDKNGKDKIFGVPLYKSTEVLAYNGTFIEYCKTLESKGGEYANIGTIPQTWQQWEVKGPTYRKIMDDLIDNKKCIYGNQDNTGLATQLEATSNQGETYNGKTRLMDFTEINKDTTRVLTWDSLDNAFITLIKQWGAQYTNLPENQKDVSPHRRTGDLLFASSTNRPIVENCLTFFKNLNTKRVFGTPSALGSSLYSLQAFEAGNVMFTICSSGGINYNSERLWKNRMRFAPIPYYDDGVNVRKYVVSQGANICMTKAANPEYAVNVVKELTSGELQTKLCMDTGYYPCSIKSANSAEYQAFLSEGKEESITKYAEEQGISRDQAEKLAYASASKVAFREGSIVNSDVYMKAVNGWTKFVDDAFIGSSTIREVVKLGFQTALESDIDVREVIETIIRDPSVKYVPTINIVH